MTIDQIKEQMSIQDVLAHYGYAINKNKHTGPKATAESPSRPQRRQAPDTRTLCKQHSPGPSGVDQSDPGEMRPSMQSVQQAWECNPQTA